MGELSGQPELREALLAASDVSEVDAEIGERLVFGCLRADGPRQRERLQAGRQRLRIAPGQVQSVAERGQRLRALR